MKEFKGTPGEWVADIRNGCAAIYPKDRSDDTPGCHYSDERNIAYSSKGASYDAVKWHWSLDPSVEHDFRLMATAPELLKELQILVQCVIELENHYDFASDVIVDSAQMIIAKALGETK